MDTTMDDMMEVFESVWSEVIRIYKDDWKKHIEESEDGGLDSFPTSFFSESDLETEFLCLLRGEFRKNSFKNRHITVKNQLRFGYSTFGDLPELAQRIKKLKHRLEVETEQNSFVPDIGVDIASKDNNDPFLIFAELKYWPEVAPFRKNVQEISKKEQGDVRRLRTQCPYASTGSRRESV